MGVVLAKFRKRKTTEEVLKHLHEEIQEIEKYSFDTQAQKKRFVGNFLASSIGVYVIAFIIFYFVYYPKTWKERFIYFVPLLLFPLIIFLLRRLLTWYFQRKLDKNAKKLKILRDEKKKILDQVMDKETYKVAVNLLSQYGDKSIVSKPSFGATPRASATNTSFLNKSTRSLSTTSINQVGAGGGEGALKPGLSTTMLATPKQVSFVNPLPPSSPDVRLLKTPQMQQLRRRTPFPIINHQEKGVLEKVADYFIGDGPHDRFAMICQVCFSHNGMAVKEEFDYATFRCAFCFALNPARKSRPVAPRLPDARSPLAIRKNSTDSTSSSSTSSDTELNNGEDKRHELPQAKDSEVNSKTENEGVPSAPEADTLVDATEFIIDKADEIEDSFESINSAEMQVQDNMEVTESSSNQDQTNYDMSELKKSLMQLSNTLEKGVES